MKRLLALLLACTFFAAAAAEIRLAGSRDEQLLESFLYAGRADAVTLTLKLGKPELAAKKSAPGVRILVNGEFLTAAALPEADRARMDESGTLRLAAEAREYRFDLTSLLPPAGSIQVAVRNQSPSDRPVVTVAGVAVSGLSRLPEPEKPLLAAALKPGESAEAVFTLPPDAGRNCRLLVRCRAESDKFNKQTHMLRLRLNGEVVRPLLPPKRRVLNRESLLFHHQAPGTPRHGDPGEWVLPLFRENIGGGTKQEAERSALCKEGMYLVRLSPDYHVRRRDYRTGGQDFCYLFDLSDLVRAGENRLTVQNGALTASKLVLHVELCPLPGGPPSPLTAVTPPPSPAVREAAFALDAARGLIDWRFDGRPGARTLLAADARVFDTPERRVEVGRRDAVEQSGELRFTVRSRFHNPHGFPVLLKETVRHEFADDFSALRVAGLEYPVSLFYQKTLESPEWKRKPLWRRYNVNPTAFAAFAGRAGGVGFLLLDERSRNHHAFETVEPEQRRLGWESGCFKIPPKDSIELAWQLELPAAGDYFSFVNGVRRQLKLNGTTMRNFSFSSLDHLLEKGIEELREELAFHRVDAVITWGGYVWPGDRRGKPPYDIIFGAPVMNPPYRDYLALLAEAGRRLKQAAPEVKFYPYIHLTLAGPFTSAEVAKYRAEICFMADGLPNARTWGSRDPKSRMKPDTASYSMTPRPGGAYAVAMRETAEYYLREVGADGFFLDEYSGHFYDFRGESELYDLSRDGVAVPVRTVGLHGNPFVGALMRELHGRGVGFCGNGGNLNLKLDGGIDFCPTFSEARLNLYQPQETVHLATPFGLWYRPEVETVRMLLGIGVAPVGTTLSWKKNYTAHLYPFTPREIGRGFVIGEEALITAVPLALPADFTGRETSHYAYDREGRLETRRRNCAPGAVAEVPAAGFLIVRK